MAESHAELLEFKVRILNFVTDLFDLTHTVAGEYLRSFIYPWQALAGLGEFISGLSKGLGDDYIKISPNAWAHKTAKIAPTAYIGENVIIGAGTEVRHCAFIRGNALVGENCVIGNSTELKNCIIFDCAQVPHFNYVGDSILGFKSHLGAGAITSNVKSDYGEVVIKCDPPVATGLLKVGAMVGDFAEVGCGSVLNPGTVIGRRTTVYPLVPVRGVIPADSIVKGAGNVVSKD